MIHRSTIATLGVAAALAGTAAGAIPLETSERYAYSTYRERVDAIDLLVDGYPASLHPHDAYIPVPIAVARVGVGASVPLTPESFRLLDAKGNAVPAATYTELLRGYGKMGFDRSMLARRPLTLGSYYGSFVRVHGTFFPPPEAGSRTGRIEVPAFGLYRDVLYFPMPPARLSGVLTLEMAVPGAAPIRVRFVASAEGLGAHASGASVTPPRRA